MVRERVEESGDMVGFQAMQELLKLDSRPDAVFCYNDLTAIGAIEATLQAGLRVPEDIAFDRLRKPSICELPASSLQFDRPWDDGVGTDRGRVCVGTLREAGARPEEHSCSVDAGGAGVFCRRALRNDLQR